MNTDKNLTLIFNHFEKEHLGKDVFLVPYYLGKLLHYDVTIVYPRTVTNVDFPEELKGVRLVPLTFNKRLSFFPLWRTWNFYMYLLRNARSVNFLMRFHYSLHTQLMIILYKLLNRNGKTYVKLDIGFESIEREHNCQKRSWIKKMVKAWISRHFIENVNLVSCETAQAYQLLRESPLERFKFGDKLFLMPNGFDEELLESYNLKERTFAEKENLIITVGRLGTPQKNTDMFLRALSNVDLREWKVCLIGPIEESFQSNINAFFGRHPEKKEQVIFTGPIYNKNELWEYYNRAKVFVLTSSWESYGLVLNEAQRFRNYLVSSPVGAFEDLSCYGKYGKKVGLNNDGDLADTLADIVNGKIDIDVYRNFDATSLSWENMVKLLNL